MHEGFQFIGCEIDEQYAVIAKARIEYEDAWVRKQKIETDQSRSFSALPDLPSPIARRVISNSQVGCRFLLKFFSHSLFFSVECPDVSFYETSFSSSAISLPSRFWYFGTCDLES